MSVEHAFDEKKGKVRPKPKQPAPEPQKGDGSAGSGHLGSKVDSHTLAQMQQTVGNAAVQRFLAQRSGSGAAELDEETAATINAARGSGHSLDEGVATKAGQAMGQEFGDVHVHTGGQADQLNRQLGAKAFTTGNDIFFREGEYDPASSSGQRLIAHELTHVAQQGASSPPAVQGKMTVNDPNDQFEAEADRVADTVMAGSEPAVQRQEEVVEEEEPEAVQMQEELDEEEPEAIQMQEEEELEEEAEV